MQHSHHAMWSRRYAGSGKSSDAAKTDARAARAHRETRPGWHRPWCLHRATTINLHPPNAHRVRRDEIDIRLQPRKSCAIEDAACVIGERQHTDQHAHRTQECVEIFGTRKGRDASHFPRHARPSENRIFKRRDGFGDACTDRPSCALDRRQLFLDALILLRLIGSELARLAKNRVAYVLSHLRAPASIQQTYYRDAAQQGDSIRQTNNPVYTGTEIEYRFQLRLAREKCWEWCPQHGVVGLPCGAIGCPRPNLCAWEMFAETRQPFFASVAGREEDDFHGDQFSGFTL